MPIIYRKTKLNDDKKGKIIVSIDDSLTIWIRSVIFSVFMFSELLRGVKSLFEVGVDGRRSWQFFGN
jgi:hypothetical protein